MVRGDSIEGLHTFNAKKNILWDSFEKSVIDKSFSKAMHIAEKLNDKALDKT